MSDKTLALGFTIEGAFLHLPASDSTGSHESCRPVTEQEVLLYREAERLEQQVAELGRLNHDLKVGVKLMIGRSNNVPWTEISDSTVIALLADVAKAGRGGQP